MKEQHRRLIGIALVIVGAQALLVAGYRWVERRKHSREAAFQFERVAQRPAPDVALLGPDGTRQRLAELTDKPVLLHFWATYCPPCKEELPGLLALGRELRERDGLRLVALSMDENWDVVRSFFGGQIPAEIKLDAASSAAKAYDVTELPDTYLIGAGGKLRLRVGGARDWTTEAARQVLIDEGQRETSR